MPRKTAEDHRHDEQMRALDRIRTERMRARITAQVNAKLAPIRHYVTNKMPSRR